MSEGAPEHFESQWPAGHVPPARQTPLAYGTADGPRRAGQWWFVVAVLLAGILSFGGVWGVFEYRARRSAGPTNAVLSPPAAGQSGLPSLTGPLGSGLSPGLAPAQSVPAYDARPGQLEATQCGTNL